MAEKEPAPDQPANSRRPFIGMVVLYYPAPDEGIGGGHRGLPAIVTSVDGLTPDYGLSLAVIDLSARMVARSRPVGRKTWEAAGADPSVAHWEPTEPRAADPE
jgi:hypothetical protein